MAVEKGKAYGNKTAEKDRPAIRKGDNYSTPYSLTELLFLKVNFDKSKTVLEPAAGEGHMVKVLSRMFKEVWSFDPVYGIKHYIDDKNIKRNEFDCSSYSFLTHDFYGLYDSVDYIITNPPYSLADKFVLCAKEFNIEKICFLLRTNYLSGQGRLKKGVFDHLKQVLVFNRMPDLRAPIRVDGKFPTAMNVYAWFVWEKDYFGTPVIDWIDCSKYAIKKKEIESDYLKQLIELGIYNPKNKSKERFNGVFC